MADRRKILEVAELIKFRGRANFIIGAGASKSAGIPDGNGLIERIAAAFPNLLATLNLDDRQNYGVVMSKLRKADRERLITPLLENAKTNWGHIALAAILRGNLVERVLTFNFDLLLERAASMLGVHLPVYDFGGGATGDVNRLVSPSIVHLHGQSHGMILLNSVKETDAHAERLRPVLSQALCNHPTIIIGYSGLKDAAFPILEEVYDGRNALYWLGYSENPSPQVRAFTAREGAEYIGGCDFDRVMIELAKALDVWPPLILKNPMDHVTEVLEPTTEFPVGDQGDEDFLSSIRSRLADFSARWESEATPDSRAFDAGLGIADDSGTAGANGDMGNDDQSLSEGAKLALAWSLIGQGNVLHGEAGTLTGDAARAKFVEAAVKYAEAVRIKPDIDAAFYNWGLAIAGEARTLTGDAARAKFVEAGAKYAEAVRIKPDKHEAFFSWGSTLLRLSHLQAGDDREASLTLAMGVLTKAAAISGKGSYNLACLHAIRGDVEKAVAELQACQRDGTLPDAAHLDADVDLDGIRQHPAYLAFRASLT